MANLYIKVMMRRALDVRLPYQVLHGNTRSITNLCGVTCGSDSHRCSPGLLLPGYFCSLFLLPTWTQYNPERKQSSTNCHQNQPPKPTCVSSYRCKQESSSAQPGFEAVHRIYYGLRLHSLRTVGWVNSVCRVLSPLGNIR